MLRSAHDPETANDSQPSDMRSPTGVELALEMLEMATAMQEQRFRREHPDASDEDVAEFLRAWMLDRPGAPYGDAEGVPSDRFG